MTPTASRRRALPTAAALEYRLPMYPVSAAGEGVYESPHGDIARITVERGAPTTRHRDVLDAIIISAKTTAVDQVGRVHIVFDLADVRHALDLPCGGMGWTRLRGYLLDLQSTVFSIRRPGDDWPESWNVVSWVGDAKGDAERSGGQFSSKLKKVVLSEGQAALLAQEARLYVNKNAVLQVLALKHRVSRNVARWLLSHSADQHPHLETLLPYVGATGERQQKTYRRQLREDAGGLAVLGIHFDGKQLHYQRGDGVFIEAPRQAP